MTISDLDNPFNITKATDFTNQQIAEYWVDFHTSNGEDLVYYLNPHDLTPKYIIGGKGCGKTHLLRYYSFPLQLLRHSNNSNKVLQNDKYIGLNIDLGAMNSARMFGCGLEEDRWDAIFGYYLELYVAVNLLAVLQTIFQDVGVTPVSQANFVDTVKRKLCQQSDIQFESSLNGLSKYINDLKKNVDYHINNAALKRSISDSDLQIKFSPGDVMFKLPALLASEFQYLRDVKFIFILDELEKLREYQKVYINTLVWDKRAPSTFWIGARTYGFTTRATKSGEILRNGSEIREIRLDQIMQENDDKYKDFAVNLCARRLRAVIGDLSEGEMPDMKAVIDEYFQTFDENTFFNTLRTKSVLRHQKEFKQRLKEGIENRRLSGVEMSAIDEIFNRSFKSSNLILEKVRIYFFYKSWTRINDGKVLLKLVFDENEKFEKGLAESKYKGFFEKFKFDFLAQLIFENNYKLYPYTGLSSFIKISSNNPRAFLVILKEVFERSKLDHENPFEGKGLITVKTQSLGIYQASKWFYEDTEAYGEDGKMLYRCINNLAEILQGIRYSDKPSETSPSSFSYKPEKVSAEAEKFIELAEIHRIILPVNGRHDKNSERVEKSYQLNRMLAPYFNLPISRRGIVPLNDNFIEAIFSPSKHGDFQRLYNDFVSNMNAPFGDQIQPSIF